MKSIFDMTSGERFSGLVTPATRCLTTLPAASMIERDSHLLPADSPLSAACVVNHLLEGQIFSSVIATSRHGRAIAEHLRLSFPANLPPSEVRALYQDAIIRALDRLGSPGWLRDPGFYQFESPVGPGVAAIAAEVLAKLGFDHDATERAYRACGSIRNSCIDPAALAMARTPPTPDVIPPMVDRCFWQLQTASLEHAAPGRDMRISATVMGDGEAALQATPWLEGFSDASPANPFLRVAAALASRIHGGPLQLTLHLDMPNGGTAIIRVDPELPHGTLTSVVGAALPPDLRPRRGGAHP